MKRFGSTDLDIELRSILAYLREPAPSRRLTAERLSRLAALVLGRDMSYSEALKILGFKPGDHPTEEEVQKVFREKVFKSKAHPDLGGDEGVMVELNIARDTLLGKRTPDVGTSYEDAETGDPEAKAIETLDKEMEALGKKPHRWIPPHNFALNRALFGWNGWYFTILPLFPKKKAYRMAKYGKPEGIVLHPVWMSFRDAEWRSLTPQIATKIIQVAKKMPPIKDSVQKELHWIETNFDITIPSGVKNKILAGAEKVAKRRIDVDRLRIKDELWPFDGSKPIKLSTFD